MTALWRFCPALIRRRWIAEAIVEDNRQRLFAIIARDSSAANLRTRAGEPLVVLAARLARQEALDYLLKHGADVHSSDIGGTTALMHCSAKGRLENVERLLSMGANPAQEDQVGLTALSLAASNGHLEILSLLESKSTHLSDLDKVLTAIAVDDPEALCDALATMSLADVSWPLDAPPIVHAAHNGSAKVVEVLLANGAGPNSKTSLQCTPLGAAAASGEQECVEILLAHGADPNHRDDLGKTPRDYAREKGHGKLCVLLTAAESRCQDP